MKIYLTVLALLWFAGDALASSNGFRHGQPPPPGIGGALELSDMYGKRFNLQRLHGKPALLFFGFTGCGSTCPMAMATARQLLGRFDQAADLTHAPVVLFVTLDPLGDAPVRLQQYLGEFDHRIIGLTGNPAQLATAMDHYGVALHTRPDGVDHSSMWYLLGRDGVLLRVYRYSTTADQLAADLQVAQTLPERRQ